MSGPSPQRPAILVPALVTLAVAYGAAWLWPGRYGPLPLQAVAGLFALLAIAGARNVARGALWWLGDMRRYVRAHRRDATHGGARWLTEREARKKGLHKRRKGSRFAGVVGSTALWLRTETHHLIIGPSGAMKTSAAILNQLLHGPESCVVNDTKGELFELTAKARATKFGHRIVKFDPKDPQSDRLNPLDLLSALVEKNNPESFTFLRGMVLQFYPEPPQEGQNKFFRDGTRRAIAAVTMAVVVVCPKAKRNLSTVYRAFCDASFMHELLAEAGRSNALKGEIAAMAEDLHRMAFGEDGAARTYEQFRIGALQALEPFGPGNYLASITAETTFTFAELKRAKVSVYIIIDYNNKETLGKLSGLLQWQAAYELVQIANNRPVIFYLDEFCNAPLHGLPGILSLLRSYGVLCVMATQDLDDIVRVYGKHELETVLSETRIKQILGGVLSKTTLEFFSAYIGNTTEIVPNYALDDSGVRESLSRTGRPLQTPGELRELDENSQVIFYNNLPPILARKVQVFAIRPWRKQIGINRMYGKKRYLKPVKVKVGRFGTKVTRRGEFHLKQAPSVTWLVTRYLLKHLGLPPLLLMIAAAGLATYTEGFPHLRFQYAYTKTQGGPATYIWCEYVGPEPFTVTDGDCPIVIFRKIW